MSGAINSNPIPVLVDQTSEAVLRISPAHAVLLDALQRNADRFVFLDVAVASPQDRHL
jgi:hypothetical protein